MSENSEPVFGFGLTYRNELVYCEVTMYADSYSIAFNNEPMAEIAYNDDMEWMPTGGLLTNETVEFIGKRIEAKYL